jgi:hypothetical protein
VTSGANRCLDKKEVATGAIDFGLFNRPVGTNPYRHDREKSPFHRRSGIVRYLGLDNVSLVRAFGLGVGDGVTCARSSDRMTVSKPAVAPVTGAGLHGLVAVAVGEYGGTAAMPVENAKSPRRPISTSKE